MWGITLSNKIENVVIIGSGPAGYTAAIYAARAGLNPLVLAGPEPGGQLVTTSVIENYPGFAEGIDAIALIEAWKKQAQNFGAVVKYNSAVRLKLYQGEFHPYDKFMPTEPMQVYLEDGTKVATKTIIIATGASARWLNILGEPVYKNKGVSACATCDGWAFRGKDVVVIGGGDTAFEEALYLSKLCRRVYLMHRRQEFRASQVMIDRAVEKNNIYFILDAVPVSFNGDDNKLSSVTYLSKKDNTYHDLDIQGAFVAIGHIPNTQFLDNADIPVARYTNGYLVQQHGLTSAFRHTPQGINPYEIIPGVFAAGDCVDSVYRQAVTAAGDGCRAALDAEKYLRTLNL